MLLYTLTTNEGLLYYGDLPGWDNCFFRGSNVCTFLALVPVGCCSTIVIIKLKKINREGRDFQASDMAAVIVPIQANFTASWAAAPLPTDLQWGQG